MQRREFLEIAATTAALGRLPSREGAVPEPEASSLPGPRDSAPPIPVMPGVWRFTLGSPEAITPVRTRHYPPAAEALRGLPTVEHPPVTVTGRTTARGFLIDIPLLPDEAIYGLGLQLRSFEQRGRKKKLRVNADPVVDSGDSHAPAPFWVTTRGYGVLVDTARYATIYAGDKVRKPLASRRRVTPPAAAASDQSAEKSTNGTRSGVLVEIPRARGADVYVFAGPTPRLAVQRYILFAGGGALPPRWGLGVWYRCQQDFDQADVLRLATEFRERRIPCDVLGLEPHWQTHAYSCSYVWSEKFPRPAELVRQLAAQHYRLNLWEHAFTDPTAPIYDALLQRSGDYEVWGGLVPDFLDPEARRIFADLQEREHVALGVSGYKLDECDNSDFTGNWSFPELSRFPSGADGEQMHCLFGRLYQDAIQSIFDRRGQRTYGLVRSAHALAAPYPYVLYSDLYDHAVFIRGVPKAGISGMLWTPEVRNAASHEDLVRRLQSAVLSPMALINAWYIRNPPWKQVDTDANNQGRFDPDWEQLEAACRRVLELRMQLVPYLHASFVRYHREGVPPFRPLVLDYPDEKDARTVDDEYLVGDGLLVAPVVAGQAKRSVYLPSGEWYDFWTGERHAGGARIDLSPSLDSIPMFVKAGTLLPLADATLHTDDHASGRLTIRAYGEGDAACTLYEDDRRHPAALTVVRLTLASGRATGTLERQGPTRAPGYAAVAWHRVVDSGR